MVGIPAVIWAKFCPSLVGQSLAGRAPPCLRVCLHPWRSTWEVAGAGQAVCCVRCLACGSKSAIHTPLSQLSKPVTQVVR